MAKQTINIGTAPNDGTGTPLRTSFDYCNLNFTELYTAVGPSGNNIVVPGTATITGDLTVRTNRLIVNSNGTGIGTTPSAWGAGTRGFELANGSVVSFAGYIGTVGTANSYYNGSNWIYTTTAAAARYDQDNGSHIWLNAPSGTAGNTIGWSTAMTLNSTGLGVGVVPSAGKGALQLSSGINFPATQVASSDANTLDDYEEGTWTPTISFATLSVGVTYLTQTGIYTKVGRIVHFSGRVDLSSKGTSVGGAAIVGLPFAANTGAASVGFQTSIAPSDKQAMLTIDGSQMIVRYASGTSTTQSTNSDFSNSSIIIFAGTYAV
jgi:hypothetical protein